MPQKAYKTTAAIISDVLYTDDAYTGTGIGSERWFAWLSNGERFYYDYPGRQFTARCERRRNGLYWYGYRRVEGKLRSVYIGRTEALTSARLGEVAERLAT